MLGMIGTAPMVGSAVPNPWKKWVDHIMKQKKRLGFKKAALVKFDGLHLACSASGVLVTESELMVSAIFRLLLFVTEIEILYKM